MKRNMNAIFGMILLSVFFQVSSSDAAPKLKPTKIFTSQDVAKFADPIELYTGTGDDQLLAPGGSWYVHKSQKGGQNPDVPITEAFLPNPDGSYYEFDIVQKEYNGKIHDVITVNDNNDGNIFLDFDIYRQKQPDPQPDPQQGKKEQTTGGGDNTDSGQNSQPSGNVVVNSASEVTKTVDGSNTVYDFSNLGTNLVINFKISPGVRIIWPKSGKITFLNNSICQVSNSIVYSNSNIFDATNLEKSEFKIDPSVYVAVGNRSATLDIDHPIRNTIADNYKLGSHADVLTGAVEDSYNVLVFEPGSHVTINKTMTLNNKNVLVIGYNTVAAQAATEILSAQSIVGGGVNTTTGETDSGKFDYIFTLYVDANGIPDKKTLAPLDATVNIQNADGRIGIFQYDVQQSSTNITVAINKVDKINEGSKVDDIVRAILTENNAFLRYLGGRSVEDIMQYQDAYRVDTMNTLNSTLVTLSAMTTGGGDRFIPTDDFRSKAKRFTSSQKTEEKLSDFLNMISENGPIVRESKNMRVWVAPVTHFYNQTGPAPQKEWLAGVLIGGEFRSKEYKYTIGCVSGFNKGKATSKVDSRAGHNLLGYSLGLYGSYGIWQGGRIDSVLLYGVNDIKQKELVGPLLLSNDHKSKDFMFDFQVSHVFKWADNKWSVRFDLGHTYTSSKTDGYMRKNNATGADVNPVSATNNRSGEIYGGIGVRWNDVGEVLRTRITGVYELGKEYMNKGTPTIIYSGANFLTPHTQSYSGTKQTTHYITVYGSVNDKDVDKNSGWKFIGGYLGKIQQNFVDTGFYLKAEYRF